MTELNIDHCLAQLQHQLLTTLCLHMNQKANFICNFSCLVETEGLLKVTGSHINRKSGNFSQLVQDRDVTADH